MHTSIGGDDIRVRLSNLFGAQSLVIGAAHVAISSGGAGIVPGSDRPLSFSGASAITIPPGALILSDPVELRVQPLSNLAVSIYVPGDTGPATEHRLGMQTNYISGPGDFTGATLLSVITTAESWFFLSGGEVKASKRTRAIVAFGDSITDGYCSTVSANLTPNILAERLLAHKHHSNLAVLDEGISGNRVLHNGLIPILAPMRPGLTATSSSNRSEVRHCPRGHKRFWPRSPGPPEA